MCPQRRHYFLRGHVTNTPGIKMFVVESSHTINFYLCLAERNTRQRPRHAQALHAHAIPSEQTHMCALIFLLETESDLERNSLYTLKLNRQVPACHCVIEEEIMWKTFSWRLHVPSFGLARHPNKHAASL